MWDDGAGPDCLHGPSSSAERLDGGGRRTRKQVEAGHNWWKERVKRLERQWTPKGTDSTIFRGVTAFFEGYTEQTSSYHLKKLLLSHGGSVSHYFSKRKTTHVICTNLSASKWTNLLFTGSGASKRVKAVHPDWLHRSCQAGVKLPEDDFLISTPNSNAKDDNPSYSSSSTSSLPPSMVSSPSSSATAKQRRRPSIQHFFAASSSSSTKRTREEILENEKRDKENIPSERKQQDYQPSKEDYKRPNSQNKQSTHQSTSLSRSSSSSSSSAAASFSAAGSASTTNKKEENEKKTKPPRKRRRNESTDAFLSRLFGAASDRQHLVQQFPLAQSVPADPSLLSQ